MSNVLIVYVSPNNSTDEVAKAIAKVVAQEHEVDIKTIIEVVDVNDYDSVIIGAPIHGFKWKVEAIDFIKAHCEILGKKKVVYFALGMCINQGRSFFKNINLNVFKEISTVVSPMQTKLFQGATDEAMPVFARLVLGISKTAPLDGRDFKCIEHWALNLLADL